MFSDPPPIPVAPALPPVPTAAKLNPLPQKRPSLNELAQMPKEELPLLVQLCSTTLEYLPYLGQIDWGKLLERDKG